MSGAYGASTATLPACRCTHARAAHENPALRPQCTASGCTCLRYWPTAAPATNAVRRCRTCEKMRPVADFYVKGDGNVQPICKDCDNTRPRTATPARFLRTRARHRATAELIERHRAEFQVLLEDATEAVTAEAERLAAAVADQPADEHEHEHEPAALPRLKPGPRRRGQDVTERLDVGRCPQCVDYHDRGHRCASCGAEPVTDLGVPA